MPLSKIQDIGNQVVPNFGGGRNILINGAMNIAQRATSATGIGANADTNKYPTMDRWNTFHGGGTAGRLTMSQDSSAPVGFANSMKLDCTTADTSIAAGEEFLISQKIEGQNLQTIAKGTADAKQLVLSWYAKGTPKTYGMELYDNDNSGRHFSNTWTVTSDWQRFTQVIPADTTGTFDDDNALSLYVLFWFHAGTTYSSGSSASSWSTLSNGNRAAGVGSIFSSTSNELFLTGVQLEVGSVATEFEHESFDESLIKCQRYYQKIGRDFSDATPTTAFAWGYTASASQAQGMLQFERRMRIKPTFTQSTDQNLDFRTNAGPGAVHSSNAFTSVVTSETSAEFTQTNHASNFGGAGQPYFLKWNGVQGSGLTASVQLDAEL